MQIKRALLFLALPGALLLGGCYIHGNPRYGGPPPGPPPEGQAQPGPDGQPTGSEQQQLGPDGQPAPREGDDPNVSRSRAPTAPDNNLVVTADQQGRAGYEITVRVTPFQPNVTLYFGGRAVPKRPSGDAWLITIPAGSGSGYVEVEWNGQRFRSGYVSVVQ